MPWDTDGFFLGCSNSLKEMDGSVVAIEGGVIDGIGTWRWCCRIQTAGFFWLSVQIPLKKWMAALAVVYQWDDKRHVG